MKLSVQMSICFYLLLSLFVPKIEISFARDLNKLDQRRLEKIHLLKTVISAPHKSDPNLNKYFQLSQYLGA